MKSEIMKLPSEFEIIEMALSINGDQKSSNGDREAQVKRLLAKLSSMVTMLSSHA